MKKSLPKQHGAWSILFVSTCAGALAGCGFKFLHILLLISGAFAMGIRHNLILWLKQRKEIQKKWMLLYSTLFAIVSILILWKTPRIIAIGIVGVITSLIALAISIRRGELDIFSELAGIMTLSLFAPASHFLSCSSYTSETFILYLLSFLFFSGSVFRVRYLVRVKMRGKESVKDAIVSSLYHIGVILFVLLLHLHHHLHILFLIAILPSVLGACLYPFIKPPNSIRTVGFVEVSYSVAFILSLAFLP